MARKASFCWPHRAVGGLDEPIAEAAAALRRSHRIKLPDAIVWAWARVNGRLLVTRDERDVPTGDPGVRTPYRL
jgi:hypothetical protein